jgi:hypothetical protein
MFYKPYFKALISALLLLHLGSTYAGDDAELQQAFNLRYQQYLAAGSQIPLPFNRMDKTEWKNLQASKAFRLVFTEPNQFYNNKTYTFKLYRAADDGVYYLDAIGGFWGMEELVYGPIAEQELK